MGHGPPAELGKDNATEAKSKLGLKLFLFYFAIYSGFVAINVFSPKTMELEMFWGVNLAVIFGFSLIITAIIMGIIYNYICTNWENKMNKADDKKGSKQ
ncbi:DUF485 domain-containing protein [bacterium]|nr:DUF485 domain-containing protein [bacterium]